MNYDTLQVPVEDWGTPKKNMRELDSTDCKRKTKLLISMSAQRRQHEEPARYTRAHHELSSDDEEDLKNLSKTIKKLHFQERSEARKIEQQRQGIIVSPFEIIDEKAEMAQSRLSLTNNLRRPVKKDSYAQKPSTGVSAFGLYRLNSMLVDTQFEKANDEYLGDNIYIKNILRQISKTAGKDDEEMGDNDSSRFDKDYEIMELCGRTGTFNGNCFKCHNKLDRMVYFVKEIRFDEEDIGYVTDVLQPILRTQMDIYTSDSENLLVRFYQSWAEDNKLYMVYQPGTFTLCQANAQKRKLSQKQVRSLLMDAASGLLFLRDRKSCHHLNLKPQNIINCRGRYKIMDMVGSLQNMQKIQSLAPSPYLAPELSGFYLDADLMKCDVYSLGVLALENMTGKEIANVEARTTDVKEMRRILRCSFQYSPGLKRLVEKMVSINPLKRPSIDQLKGGFFEVDKQPAAIRRKLSL